MICYDKYDSPLGELAVACDADGICGLWIEGQKYHGDISAMGRDGQASYIQKARKWLDSYFNGEKPDPNEIPLSMNGSDFRKAVWERLLEIPYGHTVSYGQISKSVEGERGKSSAMAVGGAVGHNPVSIIVPCHRVVGTGGSLTGYAGGLDKKIWLLRHEGADMNSLYRPGKGTAL